MRSREIPVQQTVELPGAAEDDAVLARGEVLACVLRADNADSGAVEEAALSVTWKLRIELWRGVQYTVVADAYSTLCKTQTVQTACRLLQKAADLAARIPVSIEDDLPRRRRHRRGLLCHAGGAWARLRARTARRCICWARGRRMFLSAMRGAS